MNIALYLSLQDVQSEQNDTGCEFEKNTYALTVLEFSKMSSSVNIVLITVLVLMSLANDWLVVSRWHRETFEDDD